MKKLLFIIILINLTTLFGQNRRSLIHQTSEKGYLSSSPIFKINASNKSNYAFVEGVVSDTIALDNKDEFQRVIDSVSSVGMDLSIDNIDAYFNITNTTDRHLLSNSIAIPSNFNLELKSNFTGRVQPNGNDGYMFFSIEEADNVFVYGSGTIIGDRYAHDYNSGIGTATHEWGHLINIKASHNVVVSGLTLKEASGDAFEVRGREFRNNDGTLKVTGRESNNVTISYCSIDDCRRNNISITDGTNIYIKYNTITNSGSGDDSPGISSNGISPRAGIDIEPYKNNDPTNTFNYHYQNCEYVYISNNTFSNNYSVDVLLFNGELAFVYGNVFNSDFGLSTSYGYNNQVYNNTFNNTTSATPSGKGINIEGVKWAGNGEERHTDWEIYGNTFNNYQFGCIITGDRHNVHDNIFTENLYSIRMHYNKDCNYTNNTITSAIASSSGYSSLTTENQILNTSITNGVLSTIGSELNFLAVNNSLAGSLLIDNVTIDSARFVDTQDVTFQNSTYNSKVVTGSNVTEINNN